MSEQQPGGIEETRGAEEDVPTVVGPRTEEVPETEQIRIPSPFQTSPWVEPLQVPPAQAPSQPSQPLTSEDKLRAATVAVLNLSGLGLGYVLMRRWIAASLCWIATGILLLVALPVVASGVSGGLLVLYVIVLLLAAAHGALRGLHTPLTWPRTPRLAAILAVALLLVPIGAVALYDQAHANAVQVMLLGRLDQADHIVAATEGQSFSSAEQQYNTALATYLDLLENNRSSRAGQQVPAKLAAFYQAVAAPYTQQDYCDAIAPLTYLRSLTGKAGAGNLGSLAKWPDDRLATSLYQCGTGALGASDTATTDLNQLLATFPTSAQAAKVEPAVAAAISQAVAGIHGTDPCSVTKTLQTLSSQASGMTRGTGDMTFALQKDANTATSGVESGTFACGQSQYKSGDFTDAETTMDDFASTYPHDPNKALAQNYSIAAQIAEEDSGAGKVVPTVSAGGTVSVTILNDSPDAIQILYTGPVTGTVNIGACGKCSAYSSDAAAQQDACTNSSIDYPQATISLLAGTTYFLQKNTNDATTPYTNSEKYDAGNAYIDCAYETSFAF